MFCTQLFSSEAEKLNVSKALDLSDILVPEPLPEWNIETEVSDWEAVMSCLFSTSMFWDHCCFQVKT